MLEAQGVKVAVVAAEEEVIRTVLIPERPRKGGFPESGIFHEF